MLTQFARAPESAPAPARPRAALIETRLSKFRAAVQPRVRALAAEHIWIADLALSFPAVLFALAFPRRDISADNALRFVTTGAPLAIVAQHAGVPAWMRAFEPEAFDTPIPALTDTPDFRRRVANHLPTHWRDAPKWMKNVSEALETADDEVALWFAREAPVVVKRRRTYRRRPEHQHQRLVALWAWYSTHNAETQGLVSNRWSAQMQWNAAEAAAFGWVDELSLPLYLGDGILADTWLEDGEVGGYRFVALRTTAEIQAEGRAMKHCVAGYGHDLADNHTRVWSVRRGGERVATLSVNAGPGSLPQIRELAGPLNAPVSTEMHLAARRWLHSQDSTETDPARFTTTVTKLNPVVWRRLWRPYWMAKKRIPSWLPLTPGVSALYDL
ncbi:MAG: PcfJ domain-containing protein [Hyphomonadaceae bacterium]